MLSSSPCRRPLSLALLLCTAAPLTLFVPLAHTQSLPTQAAGSVATAPVVLQYESVFSSYRAFGDAPTANWRTANDTVRQVGGWRSYAKEARLPETKDTLPPAPKPVTPMGGKP